MNRRYILPAAVVIGLGIVVFFIVARVHAGGSATNPAVPRAAVALAYRGEIANSLSVAGEFIPYQEVELHAKVAGYIRKINVDIGDRVHAGEVLAVLEVPELNAQVEGADASVRHSQDEIVRAQSELARDEADHEALHSASNRLKQAAAARPGLIAQQELDNADARDRASAAQVEAAKSALSASKQQLDVSRASHTQFSAMSDYARIVAPFDGVVTWRYADTGALVQAGTSSSSAQPVVKIAQVDTLRLRIAVPEAIAASVRVGQPAQISVQATGAHFAGKVTRLADALDRSTRTEQVEIDVPNPDRRLQPGMYADVVLSTEQHDKALLVPLQSVIHGDNKDSVMIVGDDNRIALHDIRIGMQDANSAEVLSGLKDGERVVVANMRSYQDGQLVEPKISEAIVTKDEAH